MIPIGTKVKFKTKFSTYLLPNHNKRLNKSVGFVRNIVEINHIEYHSVYFPEWENAGLGHGGYDGIVTLEGYGVWNIEERFLDLVPFDIKPLKEYM